MSKNSKKPRVLQWNDILTAINISCDNPILECSTPLSFYNLPTHSRVSFLKSIDEELLQPHADLIYNTIAKVCVYCTLSVVPPSTL